VKRTENQEGAPQLYPKGGEDHESRPGGFSASGGSSEGRDDQPIEGELLNLLPRSRRKVPTDCSPLNGNEKYFSGLSDRGGERMYSSMKSFREK